MVNSKKRVLWPMALMLSALLTQGCSTLGMTITAVAVGAGVGASITADRRTTGSMVEDETMEIKATDAIYRDPDVGKTVHVAVTSYNNIVLLTGEAPNADARARVVEIVRTMSNSSVRVIHNEIRIEPTASIPTRTHDSWVTGDVKSRLMYNVGVPTRAKVVTSGGNVYLMGLVTQDEGKRVAKIAAETRDVKSVVTVFEYLEGDSRMLNATRGKAIVVEHGGSVPALTDSANVNSTPTPPASGTDGVTTIPLPPPSPSGL